MYTNNQIMQARLLLMNKRFWDDWFKSAQTQDNFNSKHDFTNHVKEYRTQIEALASAELQK